VSYDKKISKSTRVRGSLSIRISQPDVVIENYSGGATRQRKKFDIFICFDTIPACEGHNAKFFGLPTYAQMV